MLNFLFGVSIGLVIATIIVLIAIYFVKKGQ